MKSAQPRVCLLFPHLILGGGETAMIAVAEGLARQFPLSVCALERRTITVEPTIRAMLAERLPGAVGAASWVRTPEALAERLGAADVVLWYGVNPFTPGVLAGMPQRPFSLRVVHTEKPEEGIEFHRRWQAVIDATFCVSPRVAAQIPGAEFVPNTCSPDRLSGRFEPLPPLDFPHSGPVLGYAGRLFTFKNVPWLVEHAAELEYNLVIQGLDTTEWTAASLDRLAEQAGTASRVRFLPPAPSVAPLLDRVDALVLLSQHEGFPMTVVEAGMRGLPVIATPVGSLPELFAEEILYVDLAGEIPAAASLRQALARLASEGGERGRRLQQAVRRRCSPERVVGLYADRIQSCRLSVI
jgi:glycosyltransferase involved in cell wall biosynthesis